MGSWIDRYGSNAVANLPQVRQVMVDLSWPCMRSTMIDRFLAVWFSQYSLATSTSDRLGTSDSSVNGLSMTRLRSS